jgi:hypothetical protein
MLGFDYKNVYVHAHVQSLSQCPSLGPVHASVRVHVHVCDPVSVGCN